MKFWLLLEILLTVLMGICGVVLVIGGFCMGSPIALFIGIILILFCVIIPRFDKNEN